MGIDIKNVGQAFGQPLLQATLKSQTGVEIKILNFGARVQSWLVPCSGSQRNIVVGFEKAEDYLKDTAYLGAIIGRVANRIEKSQFEIDGNSYFLDATVGEDHLHGGPTGISQKIWSMEPEESSNSLRLSCLSPEGEGGYPGAADFEVTYELEADRLNILMRASVTERTPINMVQHNYFNLDGKGDIRNHELKVNALSYTPLSSALIPTGEVRGVHQTRFDFSNFKSFLNSQNEIQAFDINFVRPQADLKIPVAEVRLLDRSLGLKIWSDQPGLQLYNSEHLPGNKFGAFCLEDQMLPAAVNRPAFPSILVDPELGYSHKTVIEIRKMD